MTHHTDATTVPKAGYILILLALTNMLNFYDRTIIAVVLGPIGLEFSLNDLQLGILGAAFTVVYAIAGLPLGRLADKYHRPHLLAGGLTAWSLLTAATGAVNNYMSLLAVRMGVGIGEASCAPAATSMIGDMYESQKRARAIGIFMLGLPIGLVLAFFTVGPMVKAFGSWRAPFFIAAVPGLILAILLWLDNDPTRGANKPVEQPLNNPIKRILTVPTMWWIILSGVSVNFAAYAGNSFLVVLLQRFYGLSIVDASLTTGGIVGVTGLVGLTLGGTVSDRIHQRSPTGRLIYGSLSLTVSAVAIFFALQQDHTGLTLFTVLFGIGWLTYYSYYTTVYPALQDVIVPRLRATAMALYFAGMYILGGAFGTVVVGGLSDFFAKRAMQMAEATEMTESFKAIGLHDAMYLIPVAMLITAVFVLAASRTFVTDHKRMQDANTSS